MKDYISREAILQEAHAISGPITGDGWDNFGVYALIERQPAADVVPVVHSRWILTTSRDDINKPERYSWNCSHCGYRRKSGESIEIRMREPKGAFCERCGARMDGGEQAETD